MSVSEKKRKQIDLWQSKNNDKVKQYKQNWNKSEGGMKKKRIWSWKKHGIKDEDIEAVYEVWLKETVCWICSGDMSNTKIRCLDHDHQTGEIRYICCRTCNLNLLAERYKNKFSNF
jgi:hypothetical protein